MRDLAGRGAEQQDGTVAETTKNTKCYGQGEQARSKDGYNNDIAPQDLNVQNINVFFLFIS